MLVDFLLTIWGGGAFVALLIGLALTLPKSQRALGTRLVWVGAGVLVLSMAGLIARQDDEPRDAVAIAASDADVDVDASGAEEAASEVDIAAAAEIERRRVREAERAQRAADAAERYQVAQREDEGCLRSLECAGERASVPSITTQCEGAVPRLAQYAFEFTDGWLEPKFSHYRWVDRDKAIVTIFGGRAQAQNGFGAWLPIVYECDVDVRGARIVDARIREGRL